MNFILYPLWAGLDLGYGLLFYSAFYISKRKKQTVFWVMAAMWLVMGIYSALAVDRVSPVLLRLLAMLLLLTGIFSETGQKGLLLLLFSFVFGILVENSVLYLTGSFLGQTPKPLEAAYCLALTGGKTVSILSAVLLRRYRNEAIHLKNSKWLYLITLLPTFLIFGISARFGTGTGSAVGIILVCCVLILTNVSIYYVLWAMEKNTAQEMDMSLQRQHMQMQTESINALEQNYRLQRKSAHEFERHIQVLDDLLADGAFTEAKEYIHRLRGSRSYRVISVNSRHTVIDVILNQKYQAAQANGIKVQIQVNDLSGITLPTESLVVILSNLLDNAIEACGRLEGYKEIDCSVLYNEGVYIAIRNTSKPVQIVDGRIDTSKPDKLRHGYGLENICYLLDKLGGEYTFDYEDGWFQFVAEIPT